jgi:hypothetical protein
MVALAAGSVAFFAGGLVWLGVACAALTVLLFAWAVFKLQRQYLKIRSARLTLTLQDAEGRVARFEKEQELVPLRRPLADIRDRNLFTQGRLDDFDVSPGEIGERMSVGKYYIIKVVFKPPLAPGVAVRRRLGYNLYDAFNCEDVSFMFVGDYPTDDVVFRAVFPNGRRPYRARAFVKAEGRAPKPAEIEAGPDRATLEWRVGRMKAGEQYHVEWSW